MQSPLNKNLIGHRFNRAATKYDQASFIQREIGKRLEERLDDIKLVPEKIVDLGCGTGKHIPSLLSRYPHADIYGVDLSAGMLKHAKQFAGFHAVAADVIQLPFSSNSVDLLFSNLMFQWCDPLAPALAECYRVLREGGLLIFSTFGPDTLQELRYCWAQIDNHPHVNSFLDMHDVGDMLLKRRFNDPVMDIDYITVTYKEVTNIMRDLQQIGASNAHTSQRKTLTGKNRLQQLKHHYQQFAETDGRLPVTYEVVYGHAWKFKNTPPAGSPTQAYISVDEIKNRKI